MAGLIPHHQSFARSTAGWDNQGLDLCTGCWARVILALFRWAEVLCEARFMPIRIYFKSAPESVSRSARSTILPY